MRKHRIGVSAFLPFNSEEVEKHLEVVSGRKNKKNQRYLSSQKIKSKYVFKTYTKTTISRGAPKKQPALSFLGGGLHIYVLYTCTCICVCIYIQLYNYTCVYVCICIYVCTYIHTHILRNKSQCISEIPANQWSLEYSSLESENWPTYPSTAEQICVSHTQKIGIQSQRTQVYHLQENKQNWRLDLKQNKTDPKRQILSFNKVKRRKR